jgi:hypothetical protein
MNEEFVKGPQQGAKSRPSVEGNLGRIFRGWFGEGAMNYLPKLTRLPGE